MSVCQKQMDDDRLVTFHLCTELPGLNTSSIMFAPFECKVVIKAGSVGTRKDSRTQEDKSRQLTSDVWISLDIFAFPKTQENNKE